MKHGNIGDRIADAIRDHVSSDEELRLVSSFFSEVADEDLLERDAGHLVESVRSLKKFAKTRDPGEALLRVFNPAQKQHGWDGEHTCIEVVTDNMPFLVDSISIALNRRGYTVQMTAHPVFRVSRTAKGNIRSMERAWADVHDGTFLESWQHMEIDCTLPDSEHEALAAELHAVLRDVAAAVHDWADMRTRAHRIRIDLEQHAPPESHVETLELVAFLDWMENNQFTFLGYREYELVAESESPHYQPKAGTGLGILRDGRSGRAEEMIPEPGPSQIRGRSILTVAKANTPSTVHRSAYLDYIGVKRFNESGEVIGEHRFLGLFTSAAYSRSPRTIPYLRKKFEDVLHKSGLSADSHNGKALAHILETLPRDELFQGSIDHLLETSRGIVQLQERQRVKLFVRRDDFHRFFACLIFVPRDRYNTFSRYRIEALLLEAFHASSIETSASVDESILARLQMTVRGEPDALKRPDVGRLEKRIADAVRSWEDKLQAALYSEYADEQARSLFEKYSEAFSAAYKEDVDPAEVPADIVHLQELESGADIVTSLGRPKSAWLEQEADTGGEGTRLRFKIFRSGHYIAISDILPILENLGLRVVAERPYEIHRNDGRRAWIQDVDMKLLGGTLEDLEPVSQVFRDAVAGVWRGEYESDRFNRLVLCAGLEPSYVMLLRAYGKYLMQTGLPFSRQYMAATLAENPRIASALIEYFKARFDPDYRGNRASAMTRRHKALREMLEGIPSLDTDRILRAFASTMRATLRTNFYQKAVPTTVSFKLDPASVPGLPLPLPVYEIFVYSPRFEAIHLRGGKVARGGLRWSNRPEDFRSEVLGLMKAQQVKNAVIVPVGAKGGFVVKQVLPGDRAEQQAVVRGCYADFLRGMLDITDNRRGNAVVAPERCVRHDDDDPYLVVAADKGTATFSDLANEVSAEYGFWLADAFASGGSVGYDHKKMGITAKGAWESVKRHFRERGIDCQTTDFTSVGIGDMSGDVFGNGMLLSRHTRLIAAFNHLHIFIDPDPDPKVSFAERKRLFGLAQSSWDDYRRDLISTGGGVYSRQTKSIMLTRTAAKALGTEPGDYAPQDLIREILKAPVDLFWNGGIGTYVKSSAERNRDVGDRANDGVRVDGRQLRCLIAGEGGNLGFTQAGRVEYARSGGRINADFIDNSGGVDCSDREVNIKILLQSAGGRGGLSPKKRDRLFLDMTETVEAQVLRDNYLQAQALSYSEYHSVGRLNEHAQLMRSLERTSGLNRLLEGLPDEEHIAELRKAGKGLTRPELAVLLAYAKNELYSALLRSDVPEDSWLGGELLLYFPEALRAEYGQAMQGHRLRDELICTSISNSIVNRMGPSFSRRMCDDTGAEHSEVARAFAVAREVYQVKPVWDAIEATDVRLKAAVQMRMVERITSLMRNATRRLLQRSERNLPIEQDVARYRDAVEYLRAEIGSLLPDGERASLRESHESLEKDGVDSELALYAAQAPFLYSALDITHISERGKRKQSFATVARVYFDLARHLPLEWIRSSIEELPVDGHWQSMARGTLRENYFRYRSALTSRVMEETKKNGNESYAEHWIKQQDADVSHCLRVLTEIRTSAVLDYASVSVALQELGRLAEANA